MLIPDVLAQQLPQEILLYKDKIPNEIPGPDEEQVERSLNSQFKYENVHISGIRTPTLTIFLPDTQKATGTAVLICPGGGYAMQAAGHEGIEVAQRFAKLGVAAFVLKYRLPDPKTSSEPALAPLQDAQQALALIRSHAAKWNINSEKVGIMGFSAGGHLAATAGTHFQQAYVPGLESCSAALRPDFLLLIYPVISSDKRFTHAGSMQRLLGNKPTPTQLQQFSNELHVTPQTPPTFLVHASDDKAVPVENSLVFYQALLQNNVPAEMHVYQNGGHGFGMHNASTTDDWFDRCTNWMRSNNLLPNLNK